MRYEFMSHRYIPEHFHCCHTHYVVPKTTYRTPDVTIFNYNVNAGYNMHTCGGGGFWSNLWNGFGAGIGMSVMNLGLSLLGGFVGRMFGGFGGFGGYNFGGYGYGGGNGSIFGGLDGIFGHKRADKAASGAGGNKTAKGTKSTKETKDTKDAKDTDAAKDAGAVKDPNAAKDAVTKAAEGAKAAEEADAGAGEGAAKTIDDKVEVLNNPDASDADKKAAITALEELMNDNDNITPVQKDKIADAINAAKAEIPAGSAKEIASGYKITPDNLNDEAIDKLLIMATNPATLTETGRANLRNALTDNLEDLKTGDNTYGFTNDFGQLMKLELLCLLDQDIQVEAENRNASPDQWVKGPISEVAKDAEGRISYNIECNKAADTIQGKYTFTATDNTNTKFRAKAQEGEKGYTVNGNIDLEYQQPGKPLLNKSGSPLVRKAK